MFQNTLRRLAALNSLVFVLIFILFGSILYGYISFRLFDRVDDAMRSKAHALRITNGRISPVKIRSLYDPRTFLLLRSTDGRILSLYPIKNEESSNLVEIASHIGVSEIQTTEVENHVYRIMSVPYSYEEYRLDTDEGVLVIQEVIAVSIVDSEVGLLRNLLFIIWGGTVLGLAAIIWAGYYLARRAMIPIQAAWDKQQQFVADASHELRSPLTVIKSNAELLLRHPGHTVEEESPRITNIVRETRRMSKLISSLLMLARTDANQAELQLNLIRIKDVFETVISQYQPLAELNGVQLCTDIDQQLEIVADKERLHQLIVILLDNALKYTPSGGHIALYCGKVDGNLLLSVEDTGGGILPEDLPRIFDRFFRGDKARSRESGGTGLGLAIAKWIVEKHGGKIKAESELGRGTKIKVILPVKNAKRV